MKAFMDTMDSDITENRFGEKDKDVMKQEGKEERKTSKGVGEEERRRK